MDTTVEIYGSKRPETILVVPHSGDIMRGDILSSRFLKPEFYNNPTLLNQVAYAEGDTGFEEILKGFRNGDIPLGVQVVINPGERICGDANRFDPTRIIPVTLFTGYSIFDPDALDEVRALAIEKYVDPYQQTVAQVIADNPNAAVVELHSMDRFGSSSSNLAVVEDKLGRGMAEVFSAYQANPELYKSIPFIKGGEVFTVEIVPAELMNKITNLMSETLSPFADEGMRKEVGIDEPYDFRGEDRGTLTGMGICVRDRNGRSVNFPVEFGKHILAKPGAAHVALKAALNLAWELRFHANK